MWGSLGRSLSLVSRRESAPLVTPLLALSKGTEIPLRGYLKPADIPLAKYGGRHTVTMLPGDGIGPEMMSYVKEVFRLVMNFGLLVFKLSFLQVCWGSHRF